MKKTIALILISVFVFTAQAKQSLEEVLAEYVEARGGMDVIKSIKTVKASATMTMGPMEAPFELTVKRPNKVYTTFEIQGMMGIQAFDGDKGWSVMPFMGKTEPEEMADDQLKQIKSQADMDGPLVDYESKGHSVELIGETEIEGTPVIEVKVIKKNGDVIQYYLDKEFKLEVMTRAKTNMMGQEVEAETYFSDYQEVGDTVLAHSMAIKINGSQVQSITFDEFELNTEVADGLFAMPGAKPAE